MEVNQIYQQDCVEGMKKLESNSIDLIFADPPYNLQLRNELYRPNQSKVNTVNDHWDNFETFTHYDDFSEKWLSECKRVLKPTGSIWVIGSYHNIFRIGKIMQDLGFWILNDIIWIKSNPMPNFKGTRFTNAHETLLWCSKTEKSKAFFNYKSMKVSNDDKQMRSDWYFPICSGKERIKENGQKVHSTQKPEALLYRIILSTSKKGDVVLDPFMGSGTTAVVAKKLARNFIGFELEPAYIEATKLRISNISAFDEEVLEQIVEQKPPKIPFGFLLESGYIKAGECLFSKNKEYKVKILADGSIEYQGKVGSIHSISAYLLNKKANNGWMYWYILKEEKLVSLNSIRQNYAKEILNYVPKNIEEYCQD